MPARKILEESLRGSNQALATLADRLQTAREEERARISRDLHDHLAQTLTAIKYDLQWMHRKLSEGPLKQTSDLLRAKLSSVTQHLDTTLAASMRICRELRPAELDDFGLIAAIEIQAKKLTERRGVVCELHAHFDETRITSEQATALFRILQEALTNIACHARATRVQISLTEENGHVKLAVRDNGRGIDESKVSNRKTLGILGMRERIRPLGGQLQVTGQQEAGTTLVAVLPITKECKEPPPKERDRS